MKRFIIGIGPHGYGGQEVPQSAVCKLQNQESEWNNSVQVQREPKEPMHKSWSPKTQEPGALLSEGRRRWTTSSRGERVHPSSTFLFYLSPQQTEQCPPTFVRVDLCSSSKSSSRHSWAQSSWHITLLITTKKAAFPWPTGVGGGSTETKGMESASQPGALPFAWQCKVKGCTSS